MNECTRSSATKELDPNTIWSGFTVFIRLCQVAMILSAGAWLGALLLEPDEITPTLKNYYYLEAKEYYSSPAWPRDCEKYRYWEDLPHWRYSWCNRNDSDSLAELIDRDAKDQIEHYHLWRSRRMIQVPTAVVFWSSVVFLGLFVHFRRNPWDLDEIGLRLPMLGAFYPPLFKKYKVIARNSGKDQCSQEIYPTLSSARKAAAMLSNSGMSVSIEWEYRDYDSYEKFIKSRK